MVRLWHEAIHYMVVCWGYYAARAPAHVQRLLDSCHTLNEFHFFGKLHVPCLHFFSSLWHTSSLITFLSSKRSWSKINLKNLLKMSGRCANISWLDWFLVWSVVGEETISMHILWSLRLQPIAIWPTVNLCYLSQHFDNSCMADYSANIQQTMSLEFCLLNVFVWWLCGLTRVNIRINTCSHVYTATQVQTQSEGTFH